MSSKLENLRPMCRPLAAVVMALLSASSYSVERSTDGYGDVVIVPYFAANDSLSTLVSIASTVRPIDGGAPLAISVSIHSPRGDGVLTEHFTVLLPANASWSFSLSRADGSTTLVTGDFACAFRNATYVGNDAQPLSSGAEGWIEAYALGFSKRSSATSPYRLEECSTILDEIGDVADAAWLDHSRNPLRGVAHLVDIPSGTSYAIPVVALKDFRNAPYWQGTARPPTLADVQPPQAVVPMPGGESRVSTFAAYPVDAVSAALTDLQWEMDFNIEPDLNAQTDLVILAPTRRWYIAANGQETRAPFAEHPGVSPDGAVETAGRIHNRDGWFWRRPRWKCSPEPRFVPQDGPVLDKDLVVAQFAETSLLGSARATELTLRVPSSASCFSGERPIRQHIQSGRIALRFDALPQEGVGQLVSDEGHVFTGLPLLGAGFTKAVNGNIGSALASFGLLQPIARIPGHLPPE